MLLRWLVNNVLRQAAEEKIREAVAGTRPVHGEEAPQPEAAERPKRPCEVAVLFALGIEAAGLKEKLKDASTSRCHTFVEHDGLLRKRRVVVVESGVGEKAARRATEDVIAVHRPAWIVSAGFAGALTAPLRRGHILLADHVADGAGNQLEIGLKVPSETIDNSPGLHVGKLLTVNHLVRTPQERKRLAEEYDAVACDMESIGVASICQQQKTRFLSVRIVSDALEDELPPELDKLMAQKSLAGKLGAATGMLFNRPKRVKDLWNLREEAAQASKRLGKFLTGVIEQLEGN